MGKENIDRYRAKLRLREPAGQDAASKIGNNVDDIDMNIERWFVSDRLDQLAALPPEERPSPESLPTDDEARRIQDFVLLQWLSSRLRTALINDIGGRIAPSLRV